LRWSSSIRRGTLSPSKRRHQHWIKRLGAHESGDNCLDTHRSLKGVSSRLLRKERPDIQNRYWKGVLWSPSYFASSCGGAPISIVRQYIEQQQTPH